MRVAGTHMTGSCARIISTKNYSNDERACKCNVAMLGKTVTYPALLWRGQQWLQDESSPDAQKGQLEYVGGSKYRTIGRTWCNAGAMA